MIERLKEYSGWVFGLKVTGRVTEDEVKTFEAQLKFAIDQRKKRPIGILADLTEMDGVDLKARWEELRFLHKYCRSFHYARKSVPAPARSREEVRSRRRLLHRSQG